MAEEHGLGIGDQVTAELVDCTPPEPPAVVALPSPPAAATPIQASLDRTIESTGADPPPRGRD